MKVNLIVLAVCSFFFCQLLDLSAAQKTLSRAPAPPPNDCSECWCQCKRLSFRDGYGRTHGNCASSYNGAQWCYVENNIGYGYSTCQDQRRSVKFPGETWSYSACATPALYSSSCRYCQGRRNSVNTSSSRGSGSRRPTIRGPDPKAEGADTGSIQNNKPAPVGYNRPVTSRPRPYSTRPTPSRYQYRGRSNRYQYQGRI